MSKIVSRWDAFPLVEVSGEPRLRVCRPGVTKRVAGAMRPDEGECRTTTTGKRSDSALLRSGNGEIDQDIACFEIGLQQATNLVVLCEVTYGRDAHFKMGMVGRRWRGDRGGEVAGAPSSFLANEKHHEPPHSRAQDVSPKELVFGDKGPPACRSNHPPIP